MSPRGPPRNMRRDPNADANIAAGAPHRPSGIQMSNAGAARAGPFAAGGDIRPRRRNEKRDASYRSARGFDGADLSPLFAAYIRGQLYRAAGTRTANVRVHHALRPGSGAISEGASKIKNSASHPIAKRPSPAINLDISYHGRAEDAIGA